MVGIMAEEKVIYQVEKTDDGRLHLEGEEVFIIQVDDYLKAIRAAFLCGQKSVKMPRPV